MSRGRISRTHTNARYIAIVIDQTPLVLDQVEPQDMVVDFVGILVETTKCVDLIVPTVRDGGVDQARRPLTKSAGNLGPVSVHNSSLHGRARHDVGVVG